MCESIYGPSSYSQYAVCGLLLDYHERAHSTPTALLTNIICISHGTLSKKVCICTRIDDPSPVASPNTVELDAFVRILVGLENRTCCVAR